MRTWTKRLFALLAVAMLVISVGCSGRDATDDDANTQPGEDTTTFDLVEGEDSLADTTPTCEPACGEGFVCENGQCVEQTQTCDPACGEGFVCENGECVADPETCVPACAEGFECDNGECVEIQTGCMPPCGDGFVCVNDECIEQAVECTPACEEDYVCVNGECINEDQGCKPEGDVANLKLCPEGPVDVTVVGATVTYVFSKGYFIQDDSAAVEVYVGSEWAYDMVEPGQVIDLHVTAYGSYNNQQEVTDSDAPVVVGSADVESMKLDISEGTLPLEAQESMVVKGNGFQVTSISGKDVTINYGDAQDAPFRVETPDVLCVGATFDLDQAVFSQFEDQYRIQSFNLADIVNVNSDACPVTCDPACEEGFECVEGQCQPVVVTCDPACEEGFECVGGQCQPVVLTCEPACTEGFECINGECQPVVVTCEPACTEGFECVNGQCQPVVVPCEPACAEGFECIEGECIQATCAANGNIANLKSCVEGTLDVTLTDVTVTYVFDKGYFIQDDSGATEIYVGNTWPYDAPAVGDVIDLHITSWSNYQNQQEVTGSDSIVKKGTADVEAMKTDISAGTLPSEELESSIIKGQGFTVISISGQNLVISYGTATNVDLRVADPGTLCAGATFELAQAIITQYQDSHRIQTFALADITGIDLLGCGIQPDADDSNWGFEEEWTTGQLVPDFEMATPGFTAERITDTVHSGTAACRLTWTSTDNQDFYQGEYAPLMPNDDVVLSLWVLENDLGGRIRLSFNFYDASKVSIGKEYVEWVDLNSPEWIEVTASFAAPEGAEYARAFIRMYDMTDGSWDGDASLIIDDWSFDAHP